jgi:hypothetical protein
MTRAAGEGNRNMKFYESFLTGASKESGVTLRPIEQKAAEAFRAAIEQKFARPGSTWLWERFFG